MAAVGKKKKKKKKKWFGSFAAVVRAVARAVAAVGKYKSGSAAVSVYFL